MTILRHLGTVPLALAMLAAAFVPALLIPVLAR